MPQRKDKAGLEIMIAQRKQLVATTANNEIALTLAATCNPRMSNSYEPNIMSRYIIKAFMENRTCAAYSSARSALASNLEPSHPTHAIHCVSVHQRNAIAYLIVCYLSFFCASVFLMGLLHMLLEVLSSVRRPFSRCGILASNSFRLYLSAGCKV